MSYVGVDACRDGWIAVAMADSGDCRGVLVSELDHLMEAVPEAQGFAIDIPIGIPARGRRAADRRARGFVGPRRSSVFFAPVHAALMAPTHREATETSRRLTGHGISQQAYALAPKILEAERWLQDVSVPVWEVHPEVSFAVLLGHPARAPKKTWAGMRERLAALEEVDMDLAGVGEAGESAAVDDVLAAAVAAWSAHRISSRDSISLPDPPEVDRETHRQIAIWA